METFICINDDFGIGIFIESRDDDKFDKKIYLDFGKFDRIKSAKKFIRIYPQLYEICIFDSFEYLNT